MTADYLTDLRARVQKFAHERDWEQFHTPKNLASALSVEAGELLEHFIWATEQATLDANKQEAVADEVADVLIYLIRLADVLSIDIPDAVDRKLAKNALRYPVALSKGSSAKYTER